MFISILLALKVTQQLTGSLGANDINCSLSNGEISHLQPDCSEYKYNNSFCNDCSLSYQNKTQVQFNECSFTTTKCSELMNFTNIDIIINSSDVKINALANNCYTPRFLVMLESSIVMESTKMYEESEANKHFAMNIKSINPEWPTIFKACTFENLHYINSGAGIIFDSTDENHYNYNITFLECVANRTGVESNTYSCGGFYYSNSHEGNSLFSKCTFLKCSAGYGGALYIRSNSEVINCKFTTCSGWYHGCGIYLDSLYQYIELKVVNCSFYDSSAATSIIFLNYPDNENATLVLDGCRLMNGVLSQYSYTGVLLNGREIKLVFKDCYLENNYLLYGVATSFYAFVSLNYTNCTFKENISPLLNLYIIRKADNLYMEDCKFYQKYCGAFESGLHTTFVQNSHFADFTSGFIQKHMISYQSQVDSKFHSKIESCTFENINGNNEGLSIQLNGNIKSFSLINCIIHNVINPNGKAILFVPFTIYLFSVEKCHVSDCFCSSGGTFTIVEPWNSIELYFIGCIFRRCSSNNQTGPIEIYNDAKDTVVTIVGCKFEDIDPHTIILNLSMSHLIMDNCEFFNIGRIMSLTMISSYNININSTKFINCTSEGPIIILNNIASIDFSDCTFRNISVKEEIISPNQNKIIDLFSIHNCSFEEIKSSNNGFNIVSSSIIVENSNFSYNEAMNGAGLFIDIKTILVIRDCNFTGNHAKKCGACIYIVRHADHLFSGLVANNNIADEAGAILYTTITKKILTVPYYEGSGNNSPFGPITINGDNRNLSISNVSVNEVSLMNLNSLVISNTSIDSFHLLVEDVKHIKVITSNISHLRAKGETISIKGANFYDSNTIFINMSTSVHFKNANFINSPNVHINSPKIVINQSKFSFEKNNRDQIQLLIVQSSEIIIIDSCFQTDTNQFESSDYLKAFQPIKLSIDQNSCFSQNKLKSISFPSNSVISASDVFDRKCSCFEQTPNQASGELQKQDWMDKIVGKVTISVISIIIIVIIIILIIFIAYVKKRKEATSKSEGEDSNEPDIELPSVELGKSYGSKSEDDLDLFKQDFEEKIIIHYTQQL